MRLQTATILSQNNPLDILETTKETAPGSTYLDTNIDEKIDDIRDSESHTVLLTDQQNNMTN